MLLRTTATVLMLACAGCSGLQSGFLDPAGPVASGQRELFFIALGLTLLVITPVIVFTPWLVWWYRRGNARAAYKPNWTFSWPLEVLAWGVPIAVVAVLGTFLWIWTARLDPYRALDQSARPLQVQAVSLDWKWLFIYPDQHVASLNRLVIPAGRSVHMSLTSETVMQSLLIPHLGGQIYTMAGMRTQLYLKADHAGDWTGENTQYNGRGFQQQRFATQALAPADFQAWLDKARASGETLDCKAYRRLAWQQVITDTRLYRQPVPGLFDWIVNKYREHPAPDCRDPHKDDPAHA